MRRFTYLEIWPFYRTRRFVLRIQFRLQKVISRKLICGVRIIVANMYTAKPTHVLHALKDGFVTGNLKENSTMLQLIASPCGFSPRLFVGAALSEKGCILS